MGYDLKIKVPKPKPVKYTLAAVNGVLVLTGLLLLLAGVAVLLVYSEYDELITRRFFNIAGFSIATGVIILLVSVFGFYAALTKHFLFIAGYVVLMLVVLVFEVALVIAAFALKEDVVRVIQPTMLASLNQYQTRPEVAKLWDDLQIGFKCCGVSDQFDFASSRLPVSCCRIGYGTISTFECHTGNAYPAGCAEALGEWLSRNAHVLAICALVAICVQIVLTATSGWLAWRSKRGEV